MTKSLKENEAWQHITSMSTVYIALYDALTKVVSFITQDGIRGHLSLEKFKRDYRHVPKMKGAYK